MIHFLLNLLLLVGFYAKNIWKC